MDIYILVKDCRRGFSLLLLYLTSLRRSNLLLLTVKHLKSLFKDGKIVKDLIKNSKGFNKKFKRI